MHLLAFEDKPTLFAGGQERSLFEVISALTGYGIKVSLCYKKEGDLLPAYKNICVSTTRLTSRVFLRGTAYRFGLDLLRAVRLSRLYRWDALYANQFYDLPFVSLLGAITRKPVFCHLRQPCPSYLSRQYRFGLMRCKKLIAISSNTKDTYVHKGIPGGKIHVLHNFTNVDHFKPVQFERSGAGAKKQIAYFGRFSPEKGIELLIDAFKQVRRHADAQLKIVGSVRGTATAEYLEYLKRLAGCLLGNSIQFLPHMADIRSELQRSELVIVPSICDEAFGRIIIEAMACEVPVIASRVGGIPEVMLPGFAELLVSPFNIDELAACILKNLNWRTSNPALGPMCREWVISRFSGKDYVKQLASILISD
jgi:glycosyltransferase involved in cell wall biosynthesis